MSNENENDAPKMKTMDAPQVEIKLEKRYRVKVAGKQLSDAFREVNTMCGMKQLVGEKGDVVVVDVPDKFEEILASLFAGEEDKFIDATLIKASPSILKEMQKAIREAKEHLSQEPAREPVRDSSSEPQEEEREDA